MSRLITFIGLLPLLVGAASARQYAPQFGAAVAVEGNEVFIADGRNRIVAGRVHVYRIADVGTWSELAGLTASDAGEKADGFGQSISVSGRHLVVGAPAANTAYVFERLLDGTWLEVTGLKGDGPDFGSRVHVNGERMLISTRGDSEIPGSVHVYERSVDGSWQARGELTIEALDASSAYGSSLALAGDHAAVGAPGTSGRAGAVHMFKFDSSTGEWVTNGLLDNRTSQSGSQFGTALMMEGSYVLVGAPGADGGIGKVQIFEFVEESASWEAQSRLTPFSATGSERFGSSMAFDGTHLWVGAPGFGAREGAVYQFEAGSSSMLGTVKMNVRGVQFRSSFGGAIAANGEIAVVGAVGQDNFEGVGFLFTASDDGWKQQDMITNEFGRFESITGKMIECEDETAGAFTCKDVNMTAYLNTVDIGANRGIQVNDVWGWEDPDTGREFALVGRTDGTSFIDLSDPYNPVFLGDLPLTSTANPSLWRDIKVYKDHAFIVSDGAGAHHMQVFDLHQLRDVQSPPVTFEETAIYKGVYSSHNIIINEDTGYAFAVGSDSGGETCGGALHMINIQDPANPVFAGCFADRRTGRSNTGSTHDAQCVSYHGPDSNYQGREICLSSNGTALSIADVTDKKNPTAISIADYPNVAYAHQGWLTEDHRYFYLNDEGDEASGLVDATRTLIFDLMDLEEPELVGQYFAKDNAIDHNLYVKGNLMYQTNYQAGLRILDISDPEAPVEVGYFDTVPYGENNSSGVLGAWSNYPYFKSGVIVVTSGREGVFFLKKKDADT